MSQAAAQLPPPVGETDPLVIAIRQAYVHTLSLWQSEEERLLIHSWMLEFIVSRRAVQLVTQGALEDLRDQIFTKVLYRDFVLELQFQFFSRVDGGLQKFTDLTHKLSQGISTDQYQQGYTATPHEIHSRLSSQEAAEQVLRSNKWLVALLMCKLHLNVTMKP